MERQERKNVSLYKKKNIVDVSAITAFIYWKKCKRFPLFFNILQVKENFRYCTRVQMYV